MSSLAPRVTSTARGENRSMITAGEQKRGGEGGGVYKMWYNLYKMGQNRRRSKIAPSVHFMHKASVAIDLATVVSLLKTPTS